jgi:predicted RecA/RadA family phage recombinase
MKTYVQPGHVVTLSAPYAVASGDGLLVGSLFGIATHDAASSAEVESQLTGVVDMAKAASQAWTVGAKVYWDNTAKVATITATGNVLIGAAMLAVGNTAGETIGRVRLNGSVA